MKKKLFLLLIPLLFITACGKANIKEEANSSKITLLDKKKGIETTFTYDKKLDFSEIYTHQDQESPSIEFDNINLDIDFEMIYKEVNTDSYLEAQKNRKNKKYYKEYTFGNYTAYIYGDYDDNIIININVKKNKDTSIILVITMNRLDSDENTILAEVLEDRDLQEFFKTIKVENVESEE